MLKQVQHDTPFITQHCALRYQVAFYWPQHCAIRYQVVRIVSMRNPTGRNIVRCAIRLYALFQCVSLPTTTLCASLSSCVLTATTLCAALSVLWSSDHNTACIFCRFRMDMGRYVLLWE